MMEFLQETAIYGMTIKHVLMITIGCVLIFLGVRYKFEPLLLLPIGFGVILGNIPYSTTLITPNTEGIPWHDWTPMDFLYLGIRYELYPPLIFLGVGAMTDFSFLISKPKLILLGAAAQVGIFTTFIGSLLMGFTPEQAASIGIIGGADGPTAIFIASKLAPEYLAPIAVAAYSYMALVPIIQPPIMRLFTTPKERRIRMSPPKEASKVQRVVFPIAALIICCLFVPKASILLGMLFFGNLLRESGVTQRLSDTAQHAFINIVTILLGLSVGASAHADTFLTWRSIGIFVMGVAAFIVATSAGVLFAKLMNLFPGEKINPLIGSAGVSAVPMAARVSNQVALKYDNSNFVLMDAMGPNVAGVIGSAVAAGVLLGFLG